MGKEKTSLGIMDPKCFYKNLKNLLKGLLQDHVNQIREIDPPITQTPQWNTIKDIGQTPILLPKVPLESRRGIEIINTGTKILKITNSSGSGGRTLKPGHAKRYKIDGDKVKLFVVCPVGGGECETEEIK